MKAKEIIKAVFIFVALSSVFFYKAVFFDKVPFPGDLLVSEYNPWRTYSYSGYLPSTFPSKLQYSDVLRQMYPWRALVNLSFKEFKLPFWNPYSFSGTPLLANFQSAAFYPLNILYLMFPQEKAWLILIFLQIPLAGIFCFLFARKIGLGVVGGLFSSIAYSLSLFMSVFLEYGVIGHTILWLPLSLYLAEILIEKLRLWLMLLFSLTILLSFSAGHLQIFAFSLIFISAYIFFRIQYLTWEKKKKIFYLSSFSLLILLPVGISSFQLFPAFELIGLSARISHSYKSMIENLLIQPYQLILFFSPDFFGNPTTRSYLLSDSYPGNALYIGLIPFIFALFSFFLKRKNYFVRFFFLLVLFLLLFLVRLPVLEKFYLLSIPFFSTGSPSNAIFLLSFSLSILSGFGIEHWYKDKILQSKIYKIAFLAGSVFLLYWVSVLVFKNFASVRNFAYSTLLFLIFVFLLTLSSLFERRKKIILFIIFVVTVFDLFYFFQKFNPFVEKELIFPKNPIFSFLQEKSGINRFWGYGSAYVEANTASFNQLFSADGYDPLYPRRYGEFIQASKDGKINTNFTNQTRSDAQIFGGFGEKDLPENYFRLKVLDLLGVRFILDKIENGSTQNTFPESRFRKVYEEGSWKIFENQQALPRVFLAQNYKIFQDSQEFERIFFAKDFDPSKTILLEEPISDFEFAKATSKEREDDKVVVVSYASDKIVLQSNAAGDRLLFLSDTYYPGWKAFVDNRQTKIYRSNYAFRAVALPKGIHRIVFEYKPVSFYLGLKASIISLIILVISSYFLSRYKKYE